MQYDDPNSTRRNLVMTSMAFIVLNAAGTEPASGDRAPTSIFYVSLKNPGAIVIIGTICLFWFAYRYWQRSPETYEESLKKRGFSGHSMQVVKLYKNDFYSEEVTITQPNRTKVTVFLVPHLESIKTLKPVTMERQIRKAPAEVVKLSGDRMPLTDEQREALIGNYKKPCALLCILFANSIRKKTLDASHSYAEWLVPWLLFLAASALAVMNSWSYISHWMSN
ncbi:hypothetical protein [Marinimicrobium agarilyticum]|uniref:hypothetical protein n=1 Tax=Marinimicrobium agarilyticum TaxID=306546 RepID=UPI000482F0F5|nr:hypothetical protein [Marinimicrobium agarilyticum]